MTDDWTLRLTLAGPFGESYVIAIGITADIMHEIARVDPPDVFRDFDPNANPLETVVTILRRREFRKDLFTRECTRLGTLLAERMEDKEGWHGIDRAERLQDWGKWGAGISDDE
jgi:hypothetical protein